MQTQGAHRADAGVTVRAVCDRCGKRLADLYGNAETPSGYLDRAGVGGVLVGYGRAVRWTCVNGHGGFYRAERLAAAYRAVAGNDRRQRVIRLPRDIARAS